MIRSGAGFTLGGWSTRWRRSFGRRKRLEELGQLASKRSGADGDLAADSIQLASAGAAVELAGGVLKVLALYRGWLGSEVTAATSAGLVR